MSLAELSLKRPVTAIMFYVSMVVIGIIASFRLPLEQFPEINVPFIMVQLPYPGSSPQEVERTIARPVEEALSTLPGIDSINSTSRADGATVFLGFKDWDRDIELAASEARYQMDGIRGDLPDDLQRYQVLKFSPSDEPLQRIRFAGDRDMTTEYELIRREFQRRIERIPGVARVDITGAPPSEVEIAINPARLGATGVALNQLAAKLQAVNFSVSAGDITDGERRIRVQPVGEIRDLDQLRNLVINEAGLKLSDVAEIKLKQQKTDFGRRLDGKPAVGLDIFREQNANLVEVSKAINQEIKAIASEPQFSGIQIKQISDQAENVTSSIDELVEAGIVGSLLSCLILFYFLRHWPSTLMVTLAIPICIVMTLGAMHFFGITLNILSMMGLLLGIGMLVDNAVVVVESIYQYREKYPNDPVRCAVEGTKSVQIAISAGTLTSIIVFLPNIFGATNQISIFLGQVAITITISLLASWLVAVSLIPMISARLKTPPAVTAEHGFVPRLTKSYSKFLRWTLEHRGQALLGIFLISLVSLIPVQLTEKDMFKNDVGREIEMYYDWKGAYSLDQISEEVLKVEKFVEERKDQYQIVQIYSWFSEQGWAGTRVTLKEPNPSLWDRLLLRKTEPGLLKSEEVQEMLRKDIPKTPRAQIGFNGGGPGGGGGGQDDGIRVRLFGDSNEVLVEVANSTIELLSKKKELRDVRVDTGDDNSELTIKVNRERAAAYGFSAQEVAQYIGIALRGSPLREFRDGESEIPVWVRFAGAEKFSSNDLESLKLRRVDGTEVPILSVVDVEILKGATQINRENRRTSLTIQANLADKVTTEDAREAMTAVLDSINFKPGYGYSFGGNFERNDEGSDQMLINMLMAMVLIYVLMAALFESLLMPLAILSSVIFSIFGMFWLFALTGTTMTIMAMIGILVLMGVVVNNGIVMFEHINALRRRGYARTDALVEGSKERLRPILMTMGTTILGMIPLCIGGTQIGGDGPAYYPMARAIVGGLIFSTMVSLLFLPSIYVLLDDMGVWTWRLVKRGFRIANRGSGSSSLEDEAAVQNS
jgi:hydrophobic/amphiphilic exporter-1 (mainly G- bacteria), HAE1 family